MKISLVTVTFNSAKTLCDTIHSVLSQSYTNIEYIIVDGLSNDETVTLIKEYEPLFQGRLKWISEKDKGLYDAMNKGIRMSTGDIVGIINSDDFYHRGDVLEKVAESFEASVSKTSGCTSDVTSSSVKLFSSADKVRTCESRLPSTYTVPPFAPP